MRRVDEAGKYSYHDFNADVQIRSLGASVDAAFEHMGLGVVHSLATIESIAVMQEVRKLRIVSPNITTLLYDYLSKLITLLREEHFISKHIYYLAITQQDDGFLLTCELHGVTDSDLTTEFAITKPTYTKMSLELLEEKNNYLVKVVFSLSE